MNSSYVAYRPMPAQSYIAREGFPFIAIAVSAAALLYLLDFFAGFIFCMFVAAFVAFFFRNPERKVPTGEGLVVAPADGRVLYVKRGVVEPETGKSFTKISIFMSILNVHVNRVPISGRLKRVIYHAGKFFVASLDKASGRNERNVLLLEDEKGREFVVVQIAGLIARRIICYTRENDNLERGSRFGLIRFGSRVDLYLPVEVDVEVKAGDRTSAGETIVGRYR